MKGPGQPGKDRCAKGTRKTADGKRAEKMLRESTDKCQFLSDATRTGYVILDERGRVLEANREHLRHFTDRTVAAADFRASEAKFRRLYNGTPVRLHSIDRSRVLGDVNDSWLATMGCERDEVIGRDMTDFYTEASRRRARGRPAGVLHRVRGRAVA